MPRARSASAHRKVLDAALELIGENGVDATSMDAIAERSGVSKATIYKHWADKDALLLELMSCVAGLPERPEFDSGDTRADLVAALSYHPPQDTAERQRTLPHFVAYAARNREFGAAWRRMVMEPPRRQLTQLLKRGAATGEFVPGLDTEQSLALLLGPMIYWKITLAAENAEPKNLAVSVVDAFYRAFGAKAAPRGVSELRRRPRS